MLVSATYSWGLQPKPGLYWQAQSNVTHLAYSLLTELVSWPRFWLWGYVYPRVFLKLRTFIHWKMFSSISGPYPLSVTSTPTPPSLWQHKAFLGITKCFPYLIHTLLKSSPAEKCWSIPRKFLVADYLVSFHGAKNGEKHICPCLWFQRMTLIQVSRLPCRSLTNKCYYTLNQQPASPALQSSIVTHCLVFLLCF